MGEGSIGEKRKSRRLPSSVSNRKSNALHSVIGIDGRSDETVVSGVFPDTRSGQKLCPLTSFVGLGDAVEQGESSSMMNGSILISRPVVGEMPFIAGVNDEFDARKKSSKATCAPYTRLLNSIVEVTIWVSHTVTGRCVTTKKLLPTREP